MSRAAPTPPPRRRLVVHDLNAERRRVVVVPPASARLELQNRILADHFSTVVPNLLAPSSSPVPIWVTPPSRLCRFNTFFIRNSLRFLLAPCPSRLDVRRIVDGVFEFVVSSRNIANVLLVLGVLRIADVELHLHPSLAAAERAFQCLPSAVPKPPVVTAGCTTPTTVLTTVDLGKESLPAAQGFVAPQLGSVPGNLLSLPPIPFPCFPLLSPAGGAPRGLVPGKAAGMVQACSFNAQRPRSYLQVARTHAPPAPSLVKTLKPRPPSNGCFRCLASDHVVEDCRDPVRCRLCFVSGHRSPDCKMPFRRLIRAAANRLRTPGAARARATRAHSAPAPTSPQSPPASPPSPTPVAAEAQLEDFAFQPSVAFLPENMVASSSSGPRFIEALGQQSLLALAQEPHPTEPLCIDKFITESGRGSGGGAGAGGLSEPTSPLSPVRGDAGAGGSRGPMLSPSRRSPGQDLHQPLPDLADRGTNAAFGSSDDEAESGDFPGSDSSSEGDSWQRGRPAYADAWVSPGRPELGERLLLPSSRGALILRCASFPERESLHLLSPISFDGHELHLLKPEETSDRFFRIPTWLAFVAVLDFPIEHWYDGKIQKCFTGFGNVAEVDPESLSGENFGPLRLLLEVNDRLELPRELRISSAQGTGRVGAVAKIIPIRVWPREFQLDGRGNLARFFGPPAPPAPGPSLGPRGPLRSQQQLRQQPHHYNRMFNPQRALAPSSQQLAFDPLHVSNLGSAASPALLPEGHPSFQVLSLALLLARLPSPGAPATASSGEPANVPDAVFSTTAAAVSAPPSPILSLVDSPVAAFMSQRVASPPLLTYSRRRRQRPMLSVPAARRSSSRLAAKAPAKFVDMTTQAVQRKALLNSLSSCSKALKKHVTNKNILSRNHLPIGAADLRKLVSAAKLGCKTVDIDGPVP